MESDHNPELVELVTRAIYYETFDEKTAPIEKAWHVDVDHARAAAIAALDAIDIPTRFAAARSDVEHRFHIALVGQGLSESEIKTIELNAACLSPDYLEELRRTKRDQAEARRSERQIVCNQIIGLVEGLLPRDEDDLDTISSNPPKRCHYCEEEAQWDDWTDEDDNPMCLSCYESGADMTEEQKQ